MKGVSVTSAYPVTWMKKEWDITQELQAKTVDGKYVRLLLTLYIVLDNILIDVNEIFHDIPH